MGKNEFDKVRDNLELNAEPIIKRLKKELNDEMEIYIEKLRYYINQLISPFSIYSFQDMYSNIDKDCLSIDFHSCNLRINYDYTYTITYYASGSYEINFEEITEIYKVMNNMNNNLKNIDLMKNVADLSKSIYLMMDNEGIIISYFYHLYSYDINISSLYNIRNIKLIYANIVLNLPSKYLNVNSR